MQGKGHKMNITMMTQESLIQRARDRLTTIFLNNPQFKECDYLLQVDSDITFPVDALEKLINADKDIIAGIYRHKTNKLIISVVPKNKFVHLKEFLTPQPCKYVSTGFLLVKRKVFEKLKTKVPKYRATDETDMYCMYYPHIVDDREFSTDKPFKNMLSEDWAFNELCEKHGFKSWAMFVGLGHDGLTNYNYDEFFQNKFGTVDLLTKFTGKTVNEINSLLLNGVYAVADEWGKANPKTKKDKEDFYKKSSAYIYDLEAWHLKLPIAQRDMQLTKQIVSDTREKLDIIDIGCGTANNILDIAINKQRLNKKWNLYAYDFDNPSMRFAKFKAMEFGVEINWITDFKQVKKRKYDHIICMDMIEHLDEPLKFMKELTSLKRDARASKVYYSIDFESNEGHPMHRKWTEDEIKEIKEYIAKVVGQ